MRLPGWSVLVAAVVIGFLALKVYGCEQRNRGELEAEIKASKERVKVRELLIVDLMKKTQRKTIKYLKADTVWQEAKATYEADPGDSTKAAAAVQACSVVERGCAEINRDLRAVVAEQDSVILEKNTQIDALESKGERRWGCAGPGVASRSGVDLGVGCGYVVHF